MITTVAVLPSTPLLLPDWPGARHPDMAVLTGAAERAVAGLAGVDVVVVLAGGRCGTVAAPPPAGLEGYGVDLSPHRLGLPPAALVEALAAVAGPVGEEPGGDLRVLARWVPAGTPTVGVVVPAVGVAGPTVGGGVSTGSDVGGVARHTQTPHARIAEVVLGVAADRRVGLLVAGDLGAGHGAKPPRPEAAAASALLDQAVVAALDNGRPADLVRLDPQLAADSGARAVGALRVLGAVLDRARIGTVVRGSGAPVGVGYVVAQGG